MTVDQNFIAEQLIKLSIAKDLLDESSPYEITKFYITQAKELEKELIKESREDLSELRRKITGNGN